MTTSEDLGAVSMDVLIAFSGKSFTYTEAGGAGQAVTGLEEDFSVDGDEASMKFSVETTDLTITNWRGAKIASSSHGTFTIQNKEDSDGHTTLYGVRQVERS